MLAQLARFFQPSQDQLTAQHMYVTLVEQAREPWFYAEAGVPDTLDGRFELILLHMFLLLRRLEREPGVETYYTLLSEAFFQDMDRSVRELGVSDTGVGHRVKKMAGAFYGRLQAYEEALQDDAALKEALQRNLYGTAEATQKNLQQMTAYLHAAKEKLEAQPVAEWLAGQIDFPQAGL